MTMKNVKLSEILKNCTTPVATALVISSPFIAPVTTQAQVTTNAPIIQEYIGIQPFNGAQFRVNPGAGVLVFHTSGQANNNASGSVHGGTILTVVNTSTPNARVQVRISGATGANAVWNGQVMWVNGTAIESVTTHVGGPAF